MPHDKFAIHIRRPVGSILRNIVTPADGSWMVLVDNTGEATFWRRTTAESSVEDGKVFDIFVDAELPTHVLDGCEASPIPPPLATLAPGALDFTVKQASECEPGEDAPRWWASLVNRAIAAHGKTEHEAVAALMNYVAQLCTAGSLDHTGEPVFGRNERRRRAVWGTNTLTPEATKPS